MIDSQTSSRRSIKVGVITDLTGPLSFMGIANANVAKMVIDDINSKGGLLGRQVDLYLEDSATTDSVAEAKAEKLVQQEPGRFDPGWHLQLDQAGYQRPCSRAGQETIHVSGAVRGTGMSPAHLLYRAGASAAG